MTIEYKMYLKILQKLRCLVAFQNKQSAPIGRDKNSILNSSKDNFIKLEKPSFVNLKKTTDSFEDSFPICVF